MWPWWRINSRCSLLVFIDNVPLRDDDIWANWFFCSGFSFSICLGVGAIVRGMLVFSPWSLPMVLLLVLLMEPLNRSQLDIPPRDISAHAVVSLADAIERAFRWESQCSVDFRCCLPAGSKNLYSMETGSKMLRREVCWKKVQFF